MAARRTPRTRRATASVVALALATSVAAMPRPVLAGPADAPPSADKQAALEEARQLYAKGKAAYETFQYQQAIDLWTEAYGKIPSDEAGIRNRMVYNIATAQEKQYEVDQDPAHLRQAILQLESWVKNFKALYKKTPETQAEVERAQARIKELQDKLAAIESGKTAAPAAEPDEQSDIGFESTFELTPEIRQNRAKQAAENESEGLIAAGWTVGGLGLLVALVGGAALGATEGIADEGSTNRNGRIGGGATLGVGLLMVAAGGVLLGVGYKKKKAVAQGNYSLVPVVGPRTAGAVFTLRF